MQSINIYKELYAHLYNSNMTMVQFNELTNFFMDLNEIAVNSPCCPKIEYRNDKEHFSIVILYQCEEENSFLEYYNEKIFSFWYDDFKFSVFESNFYQLSDDFDKSKILLDKEFYFNDFFEYYYSQYVYTEY